MPRFKVTEGRALKCAECGNDRLTVSVHRVAEDCMGANVECPRCGRRGPEIEHVWGGAEAVDWAISEWDEKQLAYARLGEKGSEHGTD